MNKKEISLILGTMCALLIFGIFMQLRTIEDTKTTVSQSLEDNALRDEVLRAKSRYDNLYAEVEKEDKALEDIRKRASENDSVSIELDNRIKNANILLGLTECKGQGVIIILDDNRLANSDSIGVTEDINDYLVHYSDLLQMINELRNAGAEAISINGQRLVATTAISCVGNVVSINGERVGTPFEIRAIGNPEQLFGALTRPDGYTSFLTRYGLLKEVKKSTDIVIPKYVGKYNIENLISK